MNLWILFGSMFSRVPTFKPKNEGLAKSEALTESEAGPFRPEKYFHFSRNDWQAHISDRFARFHLLLADLNLSKQVLSLGQANSPSYDFGNYFAYVFCALAHVRS